MVRADRLDLEFYDKLYQGGAYTETQARHTDLWHGPAVVEPRKSTREVEVATVK